MEIYIFKKAINNLDCDNKTTAKLLKYMKRTILLKEFLPIYFAVLLVHFVWFERIHVFGNYRGFITWSEIYTINNDREAYRIDRKEIS